jgi:N-glycosylase/DNA lyase
MSHKTNITINDDIDLKKIADSGQAFRIKEMPDESFRFVFGSHVLYIKNIGSSTSGSEFEIEEHSFGDSSSAYEAEAWDKVWKNYFDLNRSYSKIRGSVPAKDKFLKEAASCGVGLRILRQDPWEMLVTFIISQRKSIPAIKDSVERICEKYGKRINTGREVLYLFPSAFDMKNATDEELKDCKLGYRVSYIQDAVSKVSSGELDLTSLYGLSYEEIFEKLKEVRGVGDKVSNCICLFAYSKTEAAPVDTWISKVIEKYYKGVNPFPAYKDAAGIMQQYIFYYALTHKDKF